MGYLPIKVVASKGKVLEVCNLQRKWSCEIVVVGVKNLKLVQRESWKMASELVVGDVEVGETSEIGELVGEMASDIVEGEGG
ncbi:hypothetical protein L6164_035318 [Bauhinia variegata]|uniref:Uncharacterized protein n=1 Tax=Bauhinia variegata TaxID=167791 RepID=A0ACB9KDJ5_BAUVA|nr:hypothetical protein L6164_035318 [Bauhinia variegata]